MSLVGSPKFYGRRGAGSGVPGSPKAHYDGSSIVASGTNVTSWDDLTANNNDLTPVGSPVTQYNSASANMNGLPSVEANGTAGQYLNSSRTDSTYFISAAALSVYGAYYITANGSTNDYYDNYLVYGPGLYWSLSAGLTATTYDAGYNAAYVATANGDLYAFEWILSGANNTLTVINSSGLVGTNTASSGAIGSMTYSSDTVRILGHTASTTPTMEVGELLFYNTALSGADQTQARDHFSIKFGLGAWA